MRFPFLIALGLCLVTAIVVGVLNYLAGARLVVMVGWVLTTMFFVLFVCGRFDFVPRRFSYLFLFLCIVCFVLTYLGTQNILQKTVAFCGDGVCAPVECDGTCEDCSVELCQDTRCVVGFERCDTSDDCKCTGPTVCRPSNVSDPLGCQTIVCGDSYCDPGEDRFNCCSDCGCLDDYTCRNDICYYDTPKVSFSAHVAAEQISVTTLAANPFLTNTSGTILPLFLVRLRNEISDAHNVSIHISVGEFLELHHSIGTLHPGRSYPLTWYGPFETFMNKTEDSDINVTVLVTFYDSQGTPHRTSWLSGMTLLGRNSVDKFTHVAYFVTPDDVKVTSSTSKGIWREFQSIELVDDHPGYQFPAETIQSGRGDAEDIALLLASAYYKAGFETSLIESDYGLFVRIWEDRYFIVLDPAKIDETFEAAKSARPGYAVWDFPKTWEMLNATVLSLI